MRDSIAFVCFLVISGCHREDVANDQVTRKISWSSARYSASKDAWVFKNFYDGVSEDLASVGYTVDKSQAGVRTDRELLQESCDLARLEFGDAYRLGNIESDFESYTPAFVTVSLRDHGEVLKCVVILKFANLFDPSLQLSDGQIVYDLPGTTNREVVEKWKSSGEWQKRVDNVK
jgi:hypothetical protein